MPADSPLKGKILPPLRMLFLGASLALIALISLDVFSSASGRVAFGEQGSLYARFQVWICVVYLVDFFGEMIFSRRPRHYFATHLIFLLVSVPYRSLIHAVGAEALFTNTSGLSTVLHYVPTVRACMAMAIVMGYVSKNRIIGLFSSYMSIVVLLVYFSSMLFYERESDINPGISGYGDSLWWCVMQTTTLGASVYAITPVGKALAMVLSVSGMLMFPVFTVYLTSIVKKYMAPKQVGKAENN